MYTKISEYNSVIKNSQIDKNDFDFAISVIKSLQNELESYTEKGSGSFLAAIYDENRNIIAKCANTVVNDNCSNSHAEINVIKAAEQKLNTYDLSAYNLSIYITAEPCMMCLGAILWSGIKNVYYGVPSEYVEEITGYDEGFKQNWIKEFSKRGIRVYGNIEPELGKSVLKKYINDGKKIYKPKR